MSTFNQIINLSEVTQKICANVMTMTTKRNSIKKIHEGQSLIMVDIENQVGASELTAESVIEVRTALDLLEGANLMHVVACSHHNAKAVMFNWPKARIILKSGKDGADLALIEVATDERVGKRFDRVVIASGDGIFASVAKDLSNEGVQVCIVCGRGALSKNLKIQCPNVRYLALRKREIEEFGNV